MNGNDRRIRWGLILAVAVGIPLLVARQPLAFETFMQQNGSGNCFECHDGSTAPEFDHNKHRFDISSNGCVLCHNPDNRNYPRFTMWSEGRGGNDGLGCAGCHGRNAGETIEGDYSAVGAGYNIQGLPKASGFGLRRRHLNNGITCSNASCHVNDSTQCIQPENRQPPYYSLPEPPVNVHDPCNGDGAEDQDGSGVGLDNDGDTLYDANDWDCQGCPDADMDGYAPGGGANCPGGSEDDCDDCDPDITGASPELVCNDGKDNDCDTFTDMDDPDCSGGGCTDNDGDGYGSPGDPSCPNGPEEDCDDGNFDVNPGAAEVCDNTLDDDCDTFTDCDDTDCQIDVDGDFSLALPCGPDCDDNDPDIDGVDPELLCGDGKDNDCDTFSDCDDTDCQSDVDGDTHLAEPCGPDCDDNDGDITGVAPETLCSDGKDNDCDTFTDQDDSDCGGVDSDGDTVFDAVDNCPRVWNPNQFESPNFPGTGIGCLPDFEVKPVEMFRELGNREVVLFWPPAPQPPDPEYDFYVIYRGDINALPQGSPSSPAYDHAFQACTPQVLQYVDTGAAGDGMDYYYLVVGFYDPEGEGAYGWSDADPPGGGPEAPRGPIGNPPQPPACP